MTSTHVAYADELPWRPSPAPGVEWKKLFFDADSGESAVLLRFEPGAEYAPHRHPGGEEYLILEGSLEDGSHSYGAGTFVRHPAGSTHRPRSVDGCVLFVRLPRPIETL
ncbi:MAG: cupin domain-containing protein [Planctomycetota bacterium]